jgi:hypothetical protein
MQKSEFLKALSDMWKDFDSRVLRYKVCASHSLYFVLVRTTFREGTTSTCIQSSA